MTQTNPNTNTFFIVGIGASAGGVQALESFFDNLPDDPNAVFVVVQHLSPNHKSMMTEILQRQTVMPVREVQDQMTIEPSHVYVLPPGKNLVLENRQLHLQAKSDAFNYPINQFFQSLAQQWVIREPYSQNGQQNYSIFTALIPREGSPVLRNGFSVIRIRIGKYCNGQLIA